MQPLKNKINTKSCTNFEKRDPRSTFLTFGNLKYKLNETFFKTVSQSMLKMPYSILLFNYFTLLNIAPSKLNLNGKLCYESNKT